MSPDEHERLLRRAVLHINPQAYPDEVIAIKLAIDAVRALARRDALDQAVQQELAAAAPILAALAMEGCDCTDDVAPCLPCEASALLDGPVWRAGQDQPTTSQPEHSGIYELVGTDWVELPASQEADQPCEQCAGSGAQSVTIRRIVGRNVVDERHDMRCGGCGGRGRVGGTTQEASDG